MADQIEHGGPAFPHDDRAEYNDRAGMTLRDYFAAKALQGLLSDSKVQAPRSEFAAEAYAIADAMLKARETP